MAVKIQAVRAKLVATAAGVAVVFMSAAVPAATAGGAVVSGMRIEGAARTSLVSMHGADPTVATEAAVNPAIPDAKQWTAPNWSGWVDVADQNVALRYVTANFSVPTVKCGGNDQMASFWVGLDGFNAVTVEQVGVLAVCDISLPSGGYAPSYSSFWEMAPLGPHLKGTVSPGDGIAVSVFYNSTTGLWNLALNDSNTTAADISKSEPCPSGHTCPNASAEVIAEVGGGGPPKGFYLADFGTVRFSQAAVTSRNGTHGTLEGNSLWSANEITMTSNGRSNGTLMAQPSDRTSGYTAFSDTWHNSG